MYWFLGLIAIKCYFGAILVSILDFKNKPVKIFWLYVIAIVCSIKLYWITIFLLPTCIYFAHIFLEGLEKDNVVFKFISFVNIVIHKKESIVNKVEAIIGWLANSKK